jgi:CHASE3 domain sensor protein
MPKPAEIVAALGDVSAIESYATLRAEMVDLFSSLADWMKDRSDERRAHIFRKMAATVEMIPYDMLAEFGHSYNPVLLTAVLLVPVFHADAPDYADAHDLVLTLLDKLRSIDLDHPDTQKAIEELEVFFKSMGRPNSHARRDGRKRHSK